MVTLYHFSKMRLRLKSLNEKISKISYQSCNSTTINHLETYQIFRDQNSRKNPWMTQQKKNSTWMPSWKIQTTNPDQVHQKKIIYTKDNINEKVENLRENPGKIPKKNQKDATYKHHFVAGKIFVDLFRHRFSWPQGRG